MCVFSASLLCLPSLHPLLPSSFPFIIIPSHIHHHPYAIICFRFHSAQSPILICVNQMVVGYNCAMIAHSFDGLPSLPLHSIHFLDPYQSIVSSHTQPSFNSPLTIRVPCTLIHMYACVVILLDYMIIVNPFLRKFTLPSHMYVWVFVCCWIALCCPSVSLKSLNHLVIHLSIARSDLLSPSATRRHDRLIPLISTWFAASAYASDHLPASHSYK